MKRSLSLVVFLILTVSLSGFGESLTPYMREIGLRPLKEGTKSIDFELPNLEGKPVTLESFKGKVVFLNFFATWCGPCKAEMPSMQKLYEKLKPEGFEILAVDLQESTEVVRSFVKRYQLTFPVVIDSSGEIGAYYGARSIPTTYIIDREGIVIAGAVGSRDWFSPSSVEFFQKLLSQ
jgi:peroxiredoxin